MSTCMLRRKVFKENGIIGKSKFIASKVWEHDGKIN